MSLTQLGWAKCTVGAYCIALGIAVAFSSLLPRNAVAIVLLVPALSFGGFCFLAHIGGLAFPLIALITKGRRAAEYEWQRWWSLK
jgi:hypothetical protein